jgi:putative transposase
LEKNNNCIGLDVGLKNFITDNSGNKVENPKTYRKFEKKLKHQQRQLSKKKRGSNKRNKARLRLAKTYEKISNIRNDFLHKLSRKIVNENQVIITETLAVKNMMKNHRIAKSFGDAALGEFFRQLKYKSEWYGRIFHQVDKFFPSSKTCNKCKFVLQDLPLNVREWDCPNCHSHNDRDTNAAENILEKGLYDLKSLGLWNVIPNKKPEEAPTLVGSLIREAPAFMRG